MMTTMNPYDLIDKCIRTDYTHDGYNASMNGKHAPYSSHVEMLVEHCQDVPSNGSTRLTGPLSNLIHLNGAAVHKDALEGQQNLENALVIYDHPSNKARLTIVYTNIFGLRGTEYTIVVDKITILNDDV